MIATGLDERVATVWVDTNTMLEVYSHGDIFRAEDAGDRAIVEKRRMQMQGSLWMAMALCQRLVRTQTFEHENVRVIEKISPPGSGEGWWTRAILYILGDGGVFDGWDAQMTKEGAHLSNPARDRLMIEQCRDHGLTFVSRDREALEIAEVERVDALRPEDYAGRVLSREAARTMFMTRLAVACEWYPTAGAADEHLRRVEDAQLIFEVYRRVWLPTGSFV